MERAPFQIIVIPFRESASGFEYAVFQRTPNGGSFWQWIAGGGEDNETPLDGAKREALEESNISLDSKYYKFDTMASIPRYHFKNLENWLKEIYTIPEYSFAVNVNKQIIKISNEHQGCSWVKFDEAQ